MQDELIELLKNEYEKKIRDLEEEQVRMDEEKQSHIKNAQDDNSQILKIESQYKQKMEELSHQLHDYKEKEKKQENI